MTGYKKIAIVYDWLDKWGGVERVLLTLHEIFPRATFFTSVYDREKAPWAINLNVKTSFMQRLPKFMRNNRTVSVPLYPLAFEAFDFDGYDLVISVTSSFAKSIITKPGTRHICYLLAPIRFLWSHKKDYLKNKLIGVLTDGYSEYLKSWDRAAAQRPDQIISISREIKNRCKKYYKRGSDVIYPPFDTEYWGKIKSKNPLQGKQNPKNYFLVVSRLEPYKRVDLAIKVFNKRQENLVVVGQGSEENNLRKISGKNIIFLSKLTDQELAYLYQHARALIMPQREDFGYVSLEAQFFGCPVISYKKSGASETIIEDKTGILFDRQTNSALSFAIERFRKLEYNLRTNTKKFARQSVDRFDKKIFINKFKFL